MSRTEVRTSGMSGIALVAITYIYFLIFAQFAFLQRLAEIGISGTRFKIVMSAMAVGGIFFSLLVPRLNICTSPVMRIRVGLGACGTTALLSLLPISLALAVAVALLIGASLGLLTVTLVANLLELMGDRGLLFKIGLGTGVGYFVCNFPLLFRSKPQTQAEIVGVLCLAAICLPVRLITRTTPAFASTTPTKFSFLRVLASFTALVWLDSAAFYIIQNTPALKAGTWQESAHLWGNAVLHLAAALAGAWWLRKKGVSSVLAGAFVILGSACLLLLSPNSILLASILYPIGVSLYSVALVAYPSLLAPTTSAAERTRQAGWIYAVGGWCGSVLGIGMAQNLGHVPPAFVFVAGAVFLLPYLWPLFAHRKRELSLTAILLLAAFGLDRSLQPINTVAASSVERGRQVYISEGCISCHSQYIRPNTADVLMWGPVESMQRLRQQRPPLIGNRRQGPDLSEVGSRRSSSWLKAHFFNPAEVSGASIMPSFGFLFRDQRGADLIAYLQSLQSPEVQQHITEEKHWQPFPLSRQSATTVKGQRLYLRYCATCHDRNGHTRLEWQSNFAQLPADLTNGPFHYLPLSDGEQDRLIRLAQIAKFGIPATDMPGHEYLPDNQLVSISLWIAQNEAQSSKSR